MKRGLLSLLVVLFATGVYAELPYEKIVRIEGTLLVTADTDPTTMQALHLTPVSKKTGAAVEHFLCSGGFITPNGDIITAKHCTPMGAELVVQTYDGHEYQSEVRRRSRQHDLAILHIARFNNPYFVAPSTVPYVGESIAILGTPLGIPWVFAEGHIAKLAGDWIFVDMSVLPGNSGGVVFDGDGNAVGIATMVCTYGFGVTHLAIMESLESIADFMQDR